MAKSKQPTNVTPIRPGWTADQIKVRAFASACAIQLFSEMLADADNRLKGAEKEKLSEATKAYREIIRSDTESPPSDDVKVIHYSEVCNGLLKHDAIDEANKLARGNRKAERARVDSALREFLTNKADGGSQLDLLGSDDSTGLGLYTAEARAVAYTSLLELDRLAKLDATQVVLMTDLANAGLTRIEFVLDASEAIEAEEEEPGAAEGQIELAAMPAANADSELVT